MGLSSVGTYFCCSDIGYLAPPAGSSFSTEWAPRRRYSATSICHQQPPAYSMCDAELKQALGGGGERGGREQPCGH